MKIPLIISMCILSCVRISGCKSGNCEPVHDTLSYNVTKNLIYRLGNDQRISVFGYKEVDRDLTGRKDPRSCRKYFFKAEDDDKFQVTIVDSAGVDGVNNLPYTVVFWKEDGSGNRIHQQIYILESSEVGVPQYSFDFDFKLPEGLEYKGDYKLSQITGRRLTCSMVIKAIREIRHDGVCANPDNG